jgi:peptidoglycan/xylan/chitin deacetylase (PgdA/CDA1 family)
VSGHLVAEDVARRRSRLGVSVPGVARIWLRNRLVVLAYHGVQAVDRFRWQMEYLRATMEPVSLDRALQAQTGVRALPPRSVLVTFDDGDRSVYERGLPILKSMGIPAVCFVIAGLIGTRQPFWFQEVRELVRGGAHIDGLDGASPDAAVRHLKQVPDSERRLLLARLRVGASGRVFQQQLTVEELREMESAGIVIGNHTDTHPCLDRCSDLTVADELTRAHEALTEWLGHAPRAFAYPNGNGDPRAETVLARLGYGAAFLFDHRIGRFPAANGYRVSRVRVNSTTSKARFRNIVSGVHPLVHRMLGRS